MKNDLLGQEHLNSFDELLGGTKSKSDITELPLKKLRTFANHPFRVDDDEEMALLVESIKEKGVINPILVRKVSEEEYEIISGHRRKRACELAGIKTIPAIVRDLTDDEAIILMVDSNLHREHILPSERAFALKMKMEAIKNQGFRSDLTSGLLVQKLNREEIEKNEGLGSRQIRRYIRLTELNRDLLDLVDKGVIPFSAATNELSNIDKEAQSWIYRALCAAKGKLSIKKARTLRKAFDEGKLDAIKASGIVLNRKVKNSQNKEKNEGLVEKKDNQNNRQYICFSYSELEEIYHDMSHPDIVKKDILFVLKEYYDKKSL